jgi:hypothetical protein
MADGEGFFCHIVLENSFEPMRKIAMKTENASRYAALPFDRTSKWLAPIARDRDRLRRPRHRSPHSEGLIFKAGEVVKESGIYEAIHEASHRDPHEVVMIEANLFPPCDTCCERVCFRMVRTAPYIFTDQDFEKPGPR